MIVQHKGHTSLSLLTTLLCSFNSKKRKREKAEIKSQEKEDGSRTEKKQHCKTVGRTHTQKKIHNNSSIFLRYYYIVLHNYDTREHTKTNQNL